MSCNYFPYAGYFRFGPYPHLPKPSSKFTDTNTHNLSIDFASKRQSLTHRKVQSIVTSTAYPIHTSNAIWPNCSVITWQKPNLSELGIQANSFRLPLRICISLPIWRAVLLLHPRQKDCILVNSFPTPPCPLLLRRSTGHRSLLENYKRVKALWTGIW